MIRYFILFSLTLFIGRSLFAQEFFSAHTNVRAMGMGNAYTSIASGADALFYNPANLARNSGFFWSIADISLGTDGFDSIDTFSDLGSATTFGQTIEALAGTSIWAGGGGKTSLAVPYFAISLYNDFGLSVAVDNPVNPTLDMGLIYDYGIALGGAMPLSPFIDVGVGFKRIQRTGGRNAYGPGVITDIVNGTGTPDMIIDDIQGKGIGYAMDAGVNFYVPAPLQPTISFAWKNIGNTKFRPRPGRNTPPTEEQEMVLSAAAVFEGPLFHVVPSLDVKHINENSEPIGKKIHLGVEIGLPLIDIRGGFHQGYYTYGATVDMGFIRMDAASWGTELGGYPGQRESRRYAIQFVLEIGFDMGFGTQGASAAAARSGEAGAAGSSGAGSSSSRTFNRGLKQRR